MTKLNIGVIFGGASPEHEVSCSSAINVFNYIDLNKYIIIPIYISRSGDWYLYDGNLSRFPQNIEKYSASVTLGKKSILRIVGEKVKTISIDVVFSVIHGRTGEDGAIQGMLEMCGIPYVGCGVMASANCMDKTKANLIAQILEIPTVPSVVISEHDPVDEIVKELRGILGYPCFVKPASCGSSVGASKAKNKKEITEAIQNAFKFDDKVLVQKFIKCRELECAVIGMQGELEVSVPGEVSTPDEFYSYEAKYNNPASKNIIPANVDPEIAALAQEYSRRIFLALDCLGIARVDFFLDQKTGQLIFNEINTMPGFTNISMYPQLVLHMGYSPQSMIDKLVSLASTKL